MGFYFSDDSLKKLYECHPWLVELMLYSIRTSQDDMSIICGYRLDIDQNEAYRTGKSKLRAGQSLHNKVPSQAVDIAPYPIDWENIDLFKQMGDHIKDCSRSLGIPIIWGGDWESLKDYGHFELDL
jgi:peptidoglycan L-alanyl-D-glutamate endopeptidase CwlK